MNALKTCVKVLPPTELRSDASSTWLRTFGIFLLSTTCTTPGERSPARMGTPGKLVLSVVVATPVPHSLSKTLTFGAENGDMLSSIQEMSSSEAGCVIRVVVVA